MQSYIIGDLVKSRGKVRKVIGVYNDDVMLEKANDLSDSNNELVKAITLSGIELTPEILEKNGWKCDGIGYDYQLNDELYLIAKYKDKRHKIIESAIVYNNLSPDSYDVSQDDFYIRTISCLHQLQHLLFGLGYNPYMEV